MFSRSLPDSSQDLENPDLALCRDFLALMPAHVFQLLRYCKIKATSDDESREIVILAPDFYLGRSLVAQPELKQAADILGVDRLRVTNRPV